MKIIPIVNESDEIIRNINSSERDLRNEIMRVSKLWVVNEKGEVLLALRSKNKKSYPNIWGPSVSGTNEAGETYESNIIKEIKEELGIIVDKIMRGPKQRVSTSHEYFCQWFFLKLPSNTQFILQESEVDEVRWVSVAEIKNWYNRSPEEFVLSFSDNIKTLEEFLNHDSKN